MIEEIRVLVVPRGRDRLCWVQFWFVAGAAAKRRDYLIFLRPARGNKSARTEGCVKVESMPDLTAPLDLRKRGDAKELETMLAGVNLETLAATMRDL